MMRLVLIWENESRSTTAPIGFDAGDSDRSRLSNNRRLMKHHEVFVACSDRREVVLETLYWVSMIGCEPLKLQQIWLQVVDSQ